MTSRTEPAGFIAVGPLSDGILSCILNGLTFHDVAEAIIHLSWTVLPAEKRETTCSCRHIITLGVYCLTVRRRCMCENG